MHERDPATTQRVGLQHREITWREAMNLRIAAYWLPALTLVGCRLGELQQVGLDAKGLLGLNFLKSSHVTFDFDSRMLRLDT